MGHNHVLGQRRDFGNRSVGGDDARKRMLLGVCRHISADLKLGVGFNFTDSMTI